MRTIRTPEKGERLLKTLASGKSIAAACRSERIARNAYYEWRKADPEFAARCDQAIEEGTDLLEDKALARAEKESDVLTIFLLKARRPEKYRERSEERIIGDAAQPLTINVVERSDGPQ